MAERDDAYTQVMSRLAKAESILVGGLDNPSPGLVHLVTQLSQAVANQGLQIAEIQKQKMDVVIDEMNQPVSVSILAHDVSEIRKGMQKGLLWLAGIGLMALLILGRTAYNVFPALQDLHK